MDSLEDTELSPEAQKIILVFEQTLGIATPHDRRDFLENVGRLTGSATLPGRVLRKIAGAAAKAAPPSMPQLIGSLELLSAMLMKDILEVNSMDHLTYEALHEETHTSTISRAYSRAIDKLAVRIGELEPAKKAYHEDRKDPNRKAAYEPKAAEAVDAFRDSIIPLFEQANAKGQKLSQDQELNEKLVPMKRALAPLQYAYIKALRPYLGSESEKGQLLDREMAAYDTGEMKDSEAPARFGALIEEMHNCTVTDPQTDSKSFLVDMPFIKPLQGKVNQWLEIMTERLAPPGRQQDEFSSALKTYFHNGQWLLLHHPKRTPNIPQALIGKVRGLGHEPDLSIGMSAAYELTAGITRILNPVRWAEIEASMQERANKARDQSASKTEPKEEVEKPANRLAEFYDREDPLQGWPRKPPER